VALLSIGPELTWAAAFAAQVHPKVALALEAAGSESLSPAFSTRARTAELLLSARGRPAPGFYLYAGLGRSLEADAARGDDVRVLVGMAWRPGGASRTGRSADADGDGVPDDRDQCPREPEDHDGWQDDDGCPDPDNDGDGIPDGRDQCPNEPEDRDGYQDADGCPDADNDGDGIPDNEDWCPNAAGPTDNEGCPDNTPPEKKVPPPAAKSELPVVRFVRNQAELDAAGLTAAGRIADWLGYHKEVKRVRLEGHAGADEKRPDVLSFERAQALMRALAHRGVDPERLQAVGYGTRRPVGKAEENRRVECIVIDAPEEAK
jgi:outer membrane protein OmpA-like peptidoglycan-associated protein